MLSDIGAVSEAIGAGRLGGKGFREVYIPMNFLSQLNLLDPA